MPPVIKVKEKLKPPLGTATPHKTFRLIFRRPETAIEIPISQRIEQLRRILLIATKISENYILADIVECPNGLERFCLTFTTDPQYPMAYTTVKEVVSRLNPQLIKDIVVDGTGLDPRRIEVEEVVNH